MPGAAPADRTSRVVMQRGAMPTAGADNFAHGSYGDYGGVVFYGPPVKGSWEDRLAVSDRFIDPLFSGLLGRSLRVGVAGVPRTVARWREVTGWADVPGVQELSAADAREFVAALAGVAEADVAPHVAGVRAEQCVRCAVLIAEFLRDRVERGMAVYIEDD